MVLTNTVLLGFGLLLLTCTPSTVSDLQGKDLPAGATTTTSVKTATIALTQNGTNNLDSLPSIASSKPKTDLIGNDDAKEQKISRGSTKYTDTFTTTEKVKETSTISRMKTTTVRNDRSLSINTDRYNSPEYNIENNVYVDGEIMDTKHLVLTKDKLTTEKIWEYGNFGGIVLTTPRTEVFDDRHRKIQEDMTKSFNDVLTTARIEEINIPGELTTPKHEMFDDSFKKMQEDISKSLGASVDGFFNEKKNQVSADEEKPQLNDSQLDYTRYRSIEAIESKTKNKVHKDYNTEIGVSMRSSSDYNNSQVIDAPGIIVNTIPSVKETDVEKKLDLDQGETSLERITIEKPEKGPSPFVSNKIENELIPFTEGPEEKPFEHKNIYMSKRGSTVQDPKVTESSVPLDLYPSRSSMHVENDTSIPKTIKKDKLSTKILKKETDLDNKIPKFLATNLESTDNFPNEATEEVVTETFYEVNKYTSDRSTIISTEESATESPALDDVTETVDFFEVTEEGFTTTEAATQFTMEEMEENTTNQADTDITATETAATIEDLNSTTVESTTAQTEVTEEYLNEDTDEGTTEETYPTTADTLSTATEDVVTQENNASISDQSTILPISPTTNTAPSKSSGEVEALEKTDQNTTKEDNQAKKNEINLNGEKLVSDECDNMEDTEDYGENNCKTHSIDEGNEGDVDLEEGQQPQTEENKQIPLVTSTQAVTTSSNIIPTTIDIITVISTTSSTTTTIPPLVTEEDKRKIETTDADVESTARTDSIVGAEDEEDGGNGGKIAAIVISTIGGICLLILVALLIVMKKRQKRFNYGQRCTPVSLDAYSMDNVSIHNSTRRKGVLMASKRSYGNPAFDDPTSPSHLLNISELLKFAPNQEGVRNEFDKIPQVTTKTNELPDGCDVKNRYANVIPLPETRVFLSLIDDIPSSDYINANYVTGPQGARHYYIACQAPMQNTIEDFWRMIWEQQSKVILMLTHLYEGGAEKCIDYLPPSEVLDCHRLFGDYQITLKKREVKDKYIISTLQLKNMVSNSWREVIHLWYMGWPEKGVPDEANSLVAFLIEARSCMKAGDNKIKETNNANISNGITPTLSPVIVHCSPGTGRTGTVIACDIAIREFELTRKVDIPRIVCRIRRNRASAVQTKEQYVFIYKVISFYATKLTGGVFDSF